MEKEIWKEITGYNGMYKVSNLGNVVTLKGKEPRLLTLMKPKDGYIIVKLSHKSVYKNRRVHLLVAEMFLGHIPDGTHKIVVDHIDNNKDNNRVDNLQLITQRENSSKDVKNKTSKYTGVYFDKSRKRWMVRLKIKGIIKYITRTDDEDLAGEIYKEALQHYLDTGEVLKKYRKK
jgi:hypothetical protein